MQYRKGLKMKNAKHTPGPWAIEYLDTIKDSRGITLCHVKDSLYKTGPVGGVFNSADYREERNANARLIASSPDMLVMLEEVLHQLPKELTLDGEILRDAIKSVVVKARGEK